jgi:hypothetical protein
MKTAHFLVFLKYFSICPICVYKSLCSSKSQSKFWRTKWCTITQNLIFSNFWKHKGKNLFLTIFLIVFQQQQQNNQTKMIVFWWKLALKIENFEILFYPKSIFSKFTQWVFEIQTAKFNTDLVLTYSSVISKEKFELDSKSKSNLNDFGKIGVLNLKIFVT